MTPTDLPDDIKIIDCDAHLTEPPDVWTSRSAGRWAERMPVQRTVDGKTAWYLDGELWASVGGNTVRRGREKVLGTLTLQPFEEIDPSAWDPLERLAVLDDAGIYAQILYPNGIGFSSNHIFAIDDLEQRTVVLQTYNDFLVDYQHASGDRLLPQAMLPIWDMDLTIREMSRLIEKGIRGFTLSDRPELLGLAELPHRYFDPMWDLFNESGAVANFHIGAGFRKEEIEQLRHSRFEHDTDPGGARDDIPAVADSFWRSFGDQRRVAVRSCLGFMSNARIIVNMCYSDLFDRYPKLKVVSAESGVGWLPFMLEAMDFQFEETIADPRELALQQRRPSEYFRDHVYAMFWFEQHGLRQVVDFVGAKNILVETDYPHPTCLYPAPRERLGAALGDFSTAEQRQLLQHNAADLYQLTLDP